MVSFWPWRGGDSSPASFEKALSNLSKKIAETQARLEKLRHRSRKARVLGTLYTSFTYLVCSIVLLLVVGYKNFGALEWGGLTGGPVVIYAARFLVTTYYNFRLDSFETHLKELQEERSKTIQKLKDATKYDSTMELIEKYGGPEGRPHSRQQDGPEEPQDAKKPQQPTGGSGRTNIPPPATANIPRREFSPASAGPGSRPITPLGPNGSSLNTLDPGAEFAPNAFSNPHQAQQQQLQHQQFAQDVEFHTGPPLSPESHWYDRIFDVLLGEDETAAKNRIVLICRACRLVNGQAPPGTKSLAEVGIWKCMACGAANGEMDEGKRIVREVLAKAEGKGNKTVDIKVEEPSEDEDDSGDGEEKEKKRKAEEAKGESTGVEGPAAAVKARRSKSKK